jgi:hypothetical protein
MMVVGWWLTSSHSHSLPRLESQFGASIRCCPPTSNIPLPHPPAAPAHLPSFTTPTGHARRRLLPQLLLPKILTVPTTAAGKRRTIYPVKSGGRTFRIFVIAAADGFSNGYCFLQRFVSLFFRHCCSRRWFTNGLYFHGLPFLALIFQQGKNFGKEVKL